MIYCYLFALINIMYWIVVGMM